MPMKILETSYTCTQLEFPCHFRSPSHHTIYLTTNLDDGARRSSAHNIARHFLPIEQANRQRCSHTTCSLHNTPRRYRPSRANLRPHYSPVHPSMMSDLSQFGLTTNVKTWKHCVVQLISSLLCIEFVNIYSPIVVRAAKSLQVLAHVRAYVWLCTTGTTEILAMVLTCIRHHVSSDTRDPERSMAPQWHVMFSFAGSSGPAVDCELERLLLRSRMQSRLFWAWIAGHGVSIRVGYLPHWRRQSIKLIHLLTSEHFNHSLNVQSRYHHHVLQLQQSQRGAWLLR